MNSKKQLDKIFLHRFDKAEWSWSYRQLGIATWIYLNNADDYSFQFQITPDEVAVSLMENAQGVDFSGHEKVFKTIEEAIDYIELNLTSRST